MGKHFQISEVLINPTEEARLNREPLLAFSHYLTDRNNLLLMLADEIEENLDFGFTKNTHIDGRYVGRASMLMWVWILGAYEVVRTMSQAKSCFSHKLNTDLSTLKKELSEVRMPAAKMEKPGKSIPVTSHRSPDGWDIEKKDLLINDPDNTKLVYARNLLKTYSQIMNGISLGDVLKSHEESYPRV